jgi:hypothetical protein
MSLDWLVDPKVPSVLSRPPVLEFWGPEYDVDHSMFRDTARVLADGTGLFESDVEFQVVKAWRAHRASGGRYFQAYYRGRLVKAVHMRDCCECVLCHPEYHGVGLCMCHWPMPRKHGPGVCQCQWHHEGGYLPDVA